ncbi:MAG: response regulator transcription factor [Planctomycetota bacterium]|jgi:two-component system NtrC family response regulator
MNTDGFRILIVDDEPNIRSGLEKGLAKEADVIESASDADEGLAKFRSTPFQLVVADVRLPSAMNGLEVLVYRKKQGCASCGGRIASRNHGWQRRTTG